MADLQEAEVSQDLKVHKAYREIKETKVLLEVVVYKVKGDIQDIQEAEVSLEAQVIQVAREYLGLRVQLVWDTLVVKVFQDHKVI